MRDSQLRFTLEMLGLLLAVVLRMSEAGVLDGFAMLVTKPQIHSRCCVELCSWQGNLLTLEKTIHESNKGM